MPRRLYFLVIAYLTFIVISSDFAEAQEPDDQGFVSMFAGNDLSGWQRVNTDRRTWSIDAGVLKCTGKPIGELRTAKMYQNFIMEIEWRHMVPKGNAGIFVWADDITAKGQPFHRGIEVQVLENAYGQGKGYTTHGDIFPIHGATMKPINGRGGSRAFPTEERSNPSPQWNHYRIEAIDGDISLAVNGKVVTRGTQCVPRKGYICIESEGGVVEYRNAKIKELPSTELAPDMIAIADRGYRCLYTGIDLAGWQSQTADRWNANDWILSYAGSPNSKQPLATSETFDNYGFVFDVRLKENSGSLQVHLRGDAATISIDPANESLWNALAKPGQWNRIEGTIQGNQIRLKVNNHAMEPVIIKDASKTSGPLSLDPTGPVDFSNLYVRQM
ncbi:MAG: family 16 glycoside hydrolase [Pirellulaceae bacterium]